MDASFLDSFQLNEDRFLGLLEKLINESKFLQNNPSTGLIPKEDLVGDHVLAVLEPYLEKNGGPLKVERISYTPGRNNIIIKYLGSTNKFVSFVGSHMDVVTADPKDWTRDPFKFERDGDMLYGRGTTDCLGHVALLTDLFCQLAEKKPKLAVSVAAVFIANEENSEFPGIGVDGLEKEGRLEELKTGPVLWIDSADQQPCIGTGGVVVWRLTATGKPGHSGMPHNFVNPFFLAQEALREILDRWHKEFPPHEQEKAYFYSAPSSMKPTRWSSPDGAFNMIPPQVTIMGDIRLTPFYTMTDAMAAVDKYVAEINSRIESLYTPAPCYKNVHADGTHGKIQFEWVGEAYKGIACKIDGVGYKALSAATKEVIGECKPFSLTGSLPLVADLQDAGYDLQIAGYGAEVAYHAPNEYCTLSGMKSGGAILAKVIYKVNQSISSSS